MDVMPRTLVNARSGERLRGALDKKALERHGAGGPDGLLVGVATKDGRINDAAVLVWLDKKGEIRSAGTAQPSPTSTGAQCPYDLRARRSGVTALPPGPVAGGRTVSAPPHR